jgi:hypothetical protein
MAGAGPGGGLAAAPATEDEEALAQWADEILLGCEAEHAHAAEVRPSVLACSPCERDLCASPPRVGVRARSAAACGFSPPSGRGAAVQCKHC